MKEGEGQLDGCGLMWGHPQQVLDRCETVLGAVGRHS